MQTHWHIYLIMDCCVQAPVRSLMQMAAFVEPHVEAFADLPLNSSDLQQEQVGLCVKTSRPLSLSSWLRLHMQLHDLPSCRQPDMHLCIAAACSSLFSSSNSCLSTCR